MKLIDIILENDDTIKEIFDMKHVSPVEWNPDYSFVYKGLKVRCDIKEYDPDDPEGYTVKFDQVFLKTYENHKGDNTIYNIGYDVNGNDMQADIIPFKDFIVILKTLSEIVKDFIGKKSLFALLMWGVDKLTGVKGDNQKNAVYKSIAMNEVSSGYRIGDIEVDVASAMFPGIVIYKKR